MEVKAIIAEIKQKLRSGKGREAEQQLLSNWQRIPYREASALQTKIQQAKSDTRVYG